MRIYSRPRTSAEDSLFYLDGELIIKRLMSRISDWCEGEANIDDDIALLVVDVE